MVIVYQYEAVPEWHNLGNRATPSVKQDLHQFKTMLWVFWDLGGIIHYELLKRNKTVNTNPYVQRIERIDMATRKKIPNWPQVVCLYFISQQHLPSDIQYDQESYLWAQLWSAVTAFLISWFGTNRFQTSLSNTMRYFFQY